MSEFSTPPLTHEHPYVSDERHTHFFQIDNDVIDRYLPVIGGTGYAVYCCLVRIAGNRRVAFPGIKTIAERCGIHESTASRYLSMLAGHPVKVGSNPDPVTPLADHDLPPLIKIVPRKRDSDGAQTSSNYIILNLTSEITPPHTGGDPTPPVRYQEEDTGKKIGSEGTRMGANLPATRRKPEVPIPEDFTLTPDRLAYATGKGMDEPRAAVQFERLRNWAVQNDVRRRDWGAQWRNWVLKDIADHGTSVQRDGRSKAAREDRLVF